jgi:hypothetical protein
MGRLVHLVLDWPDDDQAVEELVAAIAGAVRGAVIEIERVGPGDTAAAGRSVARLALARGRAGGVVAHDVMAGPGEAAAWPGDEPSCFCIARGPTGVLVIGSNVAGVWAPAAAHLTNLCRLDIAACGPPPHPPARLAAAVAHACGGHAHAVAGILVPKGAALTA